MTPDRRAELLATLRAKVAIHPELRCPLAMPGLKRVLARECVSLVIEPYPRLAQLVPLLGTWTIVIDESVAHKERVVCGAHELAHLWLHHDPFFDRSETNVYDSGCPWYDAVREEEADMLAELLMRGPEKPVTPPLAPKRKRANNAVTAQLPIDFGEPQGLDRVAHGLPPIAKLERKPFVEKPLPTSREYERGVVRRGARKVSAKTESWISSRPVSDRRTDDDERIKWLDEERRATRFTDVGGMRWWIYNYRVSVDAAGNRLRQLVRDFMSPSITHRLFVNVAGVRRVYRFPDVLEQRAYRVKHLDRQLAHSHQLPRSTTKLSTANVEETGKIRGF